MVAEEDTFLDSQRFPIIETLTMKDGAFSTEPSAIPNLENETSSSNCEVSAIPNHQDIQKKTSTSHIWTIPNRQDLENKTGIKLSFVNSR